MRDDYLFKTEPFDHQRERFLLYRDKIAHAHLWEQRTGKSKVTIDTASWQFIRGNIGGLLIIAPNGVHINWIKNEIPTHMPDYVGAQSAIWNSKPKANEKKALERLISGSTTFGLRILSMNIDALGTERGLEFAENFMMHFRTMLVVDEGNIIKSMDAQRTKKVLSLSDAAAVRRVLNGTPVTQGPLDVFPQFLFLDQQILGDSFVSFRSRYADIEMRGKTWFEIKAILERIAARFGTFPWGKLIQSERNGVILAGSQPLECGARIDFTIQYAGRTHAKMKWTCQKYSGVENFELPPGGLFPAIVDYKNLDELSRRIKPFSDRVLKKDCLDLPDKIYQKHYVEMSPKQEKMYHDIRKKCLAECGGRTMSASIALTKLLRCQQIVGGFFTPDPEPADLFSADSIEDLEDLIAMKLEKHAIPIEPRNRRIESTMTEIEERWFGKVLIWARFTAEIKAIAKALREKYGKDEVVELYGEIPADVRQKGIDDFREKPSPRFAVANPAAKGVSRGQDMHSAAYEIYYSNSFSLDDRLQSEDRPHSPGQRNNLGVIDIIAPGTVDEKLVDALRTKKNLADIVTGDPLSEWI